MKLGELGRRFRDIESGRTLVSRYDVRLDWWELLDEETGEWVASITSDKLAAGLGEKFEQLPDDVKP